MIKIERKEKPDFERYSDKSVKESLKSDFYKKCYICEEATRHFEVDHFYPQKDYPHLVDEYQNLFYICQKCNKVKPKNINTKSENEILNCCEIDPENYIKLKLNSKEEKVKIEILKVESGLFLEERIRETIKLLERVYNGVNSSSDSFEDLQSEIKSEIENFRKKVDKYQTSKLKRVASKEVRDELSVESSYLSFKRWIIRDNPKLKQEFGQYLS
jgi:prefoldin subunit 5